MFSIVQTADFPKIIENCERFRINKNKTDTHTFTYTHKSLEFRFLELFFFLDPNRVEKHLEIIQVKIVTAKLFANTGWTLIMSTQSSEFNSTIKWEKRRHIHGYISIESIVT